VDTCTHVVFTAHYVWCCAAPKQDHPKAPHSPDGLSHRMLTVCPWPRP
jgi:hypothetical protein